MIGEYSGGSVDTNDGYLGNGEMDSVLDFEFNNKASGGGIEANIGLLSDC